MRFTMITGSDFIILLLFLKEDFLASPENTEKKVFSGFYEGFMSWNHSTNLSNVTTEKALRMRDN